MLCPQIGKDQEQTTDVLPYNLLPTSSVNHNGADVMGLLLIYLQPEQ